MIDQEKEISNNKDYEPIYVAGSEDLQIQGVVVGLFRKL